MAVKMAGKRADTTVELWVPPMVEMMAVLMVLLKVEYLVVTMAERTVGKRV